MENDKMDKWEELTHRIQQSILAEEPESAVSAAFQVVVEFGRVLEQMSADLDRIATAIEHQTVEISGEPEIEPPAQPVHDL